MILNTGGTPMTQALATRSWKEHCVDTRRGYFTLATEDTGEVPVRLFLTPPLLEQVEDAVYPQIVTATRFPGVKLVVITPDVHVGYGVPVGCAILTDATEGSIALGPVGFDIGCGMVSMRSDVPAEAADEEHKREFNRAVMRRVELGAGGHGDRRFAGIDRREFDRIIRGGAAYFTEVHGDRIDRSRAERDVIPVEDSWSMPQGRADRGIHQIGSLGSGNHFIELQRSQQTGTLFVQVHTGSRGFGHGLTEHYFSVARAEQPQRITHPDEARFAPGSPGRRDYLNAVAAGGNYAIVNRLVISEAIAAAFEEVFRAPLELVYEISHNLVQREWHPEFGDVWVHRKGATRAFPAGHPQLAATPWEATGHPVLIPGSNRDWSYILRPAAGAAVSGFTVNHGAGRRLSRAAARRQLVQSDVDREYRAAGILVNVDGRVPLDEAGPAYKDSRSVVEAVTAAGLATVEHELWPIASVKAMG
jgi:tRNA-splicing ligase RtcB (3'-phosphate/5'-hydroxy nucleic acid ligase)